MPTQELRHRSTVARVLVYTHTHTHTHTYTRKLHTEGELICLLFVETDARVLVGIFRPSSKLIEEHPLHIRAALCNDTKGREETILGAKVVFHRVNSARFARRLFCWFLQSGADPGSDGAFVI